MPKIKNPNNNYNDKLTVYNETIYVLFFVEGALEYDNITV